MKFHLSMLLLLSGIVVGLTQTTAPVSLETSGNAIRAMVHSDGSLFQNENGGSFFADDSEHCIILLDIFVSRNAATLATH